MRAAGTGVVETSPGVEVGWGGGVAVAGAGVEVAAGGVGAVGKRSGGPTPGLGARVGVGVGGVAVAGRVGAAAEESGGPTPRVGMRVGVGAGRVAGDSANPATVAGVGVGTALHAVCPKDGATARSSRDSNLACKLRFLVLNTTVASEPLLGPTPNSQAKDALGFARALNTERRWVGAGPAGMSLRGESRGKIGGASVLDRDGRLTGSRSSRQHGPPRPLSPLRPLAYRIPSEPFPTENWGTCL